MGILNGNYTNCRIYLLSEILDYINRILCFILVESFHPIQEIFDES